MEVSSESEEISPEEQQKIDEEMNKKRQKKKNFRLSVSAEAYGIHNVKKPYIPRVIKKTEEQITRIKDRCMLCFLFNSLVDSGQLDCEKVFKKGDPPTYLKTYQPGESFGELALLYNAPRAATIRAKTNCVLWALDRECFNNIVKDASIKKREKYENTLKKVELLKSIDPYELGQICDALKTKSFKKGDYIIKEGDKGDEFYIIDEGKCHAEKSFDGGAPQRVKEYDSCDYFGELALLKDAPRAASIIADSDCKCLALERMAFKRLLGPLENILHRNSENYVKYMKK